MKIDVFANKPFVLPPECTGDINITANITELSDRKIYTQPNNNSAISSYIVYNNVEVSANGTIEIEVDPVTLVTPPSGIITDYNLDNLFMIPAFYDIAEITINYTVNDTEDPNGHFDVKWGAKVALADAMPTWYEGNYTYDSNVMLNIIKGMSSEVSYPSAAIYTTMISTFTMDTWPGMPPIVLDWFHDTDANGNSTYDIKRGLLTPLKFKFTATNNLAYNCILNNVHIQFTWYYRTDNLMMNMRSEGDKKQQYAKIFTLPKGSEQTRTPGLDYPIYGITQGYQLDEIIKVYAFYDTYLDKQNVYFPTCVELLPMPNTSGPDFPTCIWKAAAVMSEDDFIRISQHGTDDSSDYLKVITPQMIASDDYYHTIDVKIQDDLPDNDETAIFIITTKVNDDVDDKITTTELTDNISKLRFYNVEKSFDEVATVARSEINPVFYERLYNTYKDSVVLQSRLDEPLYYIEFLVNNFATSIPIYNNGTVMFSDQLTHCIDGTRSSELFFFDKTKPNIINVVNPTNHKYKVKFHVDYHVYKNVYVFGDSEIAWMP